MDAMTKKVLLRAAELVDQGWCQWALAVDEAGETCWWDVTSPRAAAWCIRGAMLRADFEIGGPTTEDPFWRRLRDVIEPPVAQVLGGADPVEWNNALGRTADEVAAVLRQAAGTLA